MRPSRARELVVGMFSGTPGRMRLFGVVAIAACLAFGVLSFLAATRLHADIEDARDNAAQLVRIQTIRTNLVKADANATNAFLVGGLEPAAARDAYTGGIATTARTLAEAAGAEPDDAAALERVNDVVTMYTGLIESARANNRQGFPVGAAYLRQASRIVRDDALPTLEQLVRVEQQRVDDATAAGESAQMVLIVMLILTVVALAVPQVYLSTKTRRLLNPSLVVASGIVFVVGLLTFGVMTWSRAQTEDAIDGPYRRTVALATARIGAFDAKSAEALTLIARGSGAAYEERFQVVSTVAKEALRGDPADQETEDALDLYLSKHEDVRFADESGNYDVAVGLATGGGEGDTAFGLFEQISGRALAAQADDLSDDLGRAARPLLPVAWLLLVTGIGAAGLVWRGMAQRLREYR
ncbi:MAG: hypothetical protein ACXW1S_05225 [Acidimicrobiia bacterium]